MAFTAHDGRTQTALAEINMIPFIDIVLVLLIIFMITAPVIQSGIDVKVPKTQLVKEISEQKLVVTLDKEQRLYLQNVPININDLAWEIKKRNSDTKRQSVYLRMDESVTYGMIAAVMDKLKLAGIDDISMVTQPLEKSKK